MEILGHITVSSFGVILVYLSIAQITKFDKWQDITVKLSATGTGLYLLWTYGLMPLIQSAQ